jgi:hypothetical protein
VSVETYLFIMSQYGRCGVVVGILAYYARGREFDSRTVQTKTVTHFFLQTILRYVANPAMRDVCKLSASRLIKINESTSFQSGI